MEYGMPIQQMPRDRFGYDTVTGEWDCGYWILGY